MPPGGAIHPITCGVGRGVDGCDDLLGQHEHGLEDPAPVAAVVVEPAEAGQAVAHRAGRGLEPGERHRRHLHDHTSTAYRYGVSKR